MALPLEVRVGHGDGGEERLRVGVLRVCVQLQAVGQLHRAAQVHDHHAAGNILDHGKVVGDEEVGQAHLPLQVLQQIDHLRLDGHVQRRDRLVAHDESGLDHEAPGDADALALAAGELMGEAAHVLPGEADF